MLIGLNEKNKIFRVAFNPPCLFGCSTESRGHCYCTFSLFSLARALVFRYKSAKVVYLTFGACFVLSNSANSSFWNLLKFTYCCLGVHVLQKLVFVVNKGNFYFLFCLIDLLVVCFGIGFCLTLKCLVYS